MKLYKQLADFQQEVPVIHKDTEGYGYSYADLASIFKIINPLLKKHELGFTQIMEGTGLRTVIFSTKITEIDNKKYASDEKIEGFVEIPQDITLAKMNAFQVAGSSITYYRRYALSAMLGLVTDKDTDAQGEQITYAKKEKVIAPREIRVLELSEVLNSIENNNNIDLLEQMLGRLQSANNIKDEDKDTVRKALELKIDSKIIN